MKAFRLAICDLALGGVYLLELLENGARVASRVFPGGVDSYCAALEEGENWVVVAPGDD